MPEPTTGRVAVYDPERYHELWAAVDVCLNAEDGDTAEPERLLNAAVAIVQDHARYVRRFAVLELPPEHHQVDPRYVVADLRHHLASASAVALYVGEARTFFEAIRIAQALEATPAATLLSDPDPDSEPF